tara:strand:+ start:1283 stop:2530 length:1248 start_codon:yes stop_codon:yes gene_type:complete
MAINYRNIQNPQSEQLGYLKLLNDLISTSQKEKEAQRKFEVQQDQQTMSNNRIAQNDYQNAYTNYTTAMNLGKYDQAEGFLNVMYTFEDSPVKLVRPTAELNEDFLNSRETGKLQQRALNQFKSRNRDEIELGGKYLMDNMDKLQPHILKDYNQFVASPVYNNSPVYEFARANFPLDVNLYNQTVGPYSSIDEFKFRKPKEYKDYFEATQLTTEIPKGVIGKDAFKFIDQEIATKILPRLQEEKLDTFQASGGNIQSAFEKGNYRTKENIVKSTAFQVKNELSAQNPNFNNLTTSQQNDAINLRLSQELGDSFTPYTEVKDEQIKSGQTLEALLKKQKSLQVEKNELSKQQRTGFFGIGRPIEAEKTYRIRGELVTGQEVLGKRTKEISDIDAQLQQVENNIQILREQNQRSYNQ